MNRYKLLKRHILFGEELNCLPGLSARHAVDLGETNCRDCEMRDVDWCWIFYHELSNRPTLTLHNSRLGHDKSLLWVGSSWTLTPTLSHSVVSSRLADRTECEWWWSTSSASRITVTQRFIAVSALHSCLSITIFYRNSHIHSVNPLKSEIIPKYSEKTSSK